MCKKKNQLQESKPRLRWMLWHNWIFLARNVIFLISSAIVICSEIQKCPLAFCLYKIRSWPSPKHNLLLIQMSSYSSCYFFHRKRNIKIFFLSESNFFHTVKASICHSHKITRGTTELLHYFDVVVSYLLSIIMQTNLVRWPGARYNHERNFSVQYLTSR